MTTPRSVTPSRQVVFSIGDHYYDAASTNNEADYGRFLSTCTEDFYFSGSTRWLVLARLRREIRNNPYLAGLVNKYPEAIGLSTLRSRTKSREYNNAKDTFWYRYSQAVTQSGDSMRSTEDMLKREMLFAGELFVVKLMNGRVQLIPSEFCGSRDGGARPHGDGGREVNGIITNSRDEVTHYRFGQMDAAGSILFSDDRSALVEAKHVIHVFEKDRVHMGRGLPWLLPCLRPAHDLYEITRAKTKQIKDVSSIFGTLEKTNAAESLGAMSSPAIDENGDPVAESPDAPADRTADPAVKGPVKVELRPGTFIALEPGEKLNNLATKYEAADYNELVMLILHAISSPIGLPVELWFSGLGNVNYSGFKGLGTQWDARRRYLHGFFEERFLGPLHRWRIRKAADERDLPPNPDRDDDLIDWRWRRTAILDEEKAGKANSIRLESGEISHADIWEERGLYPEEVFAQRRENWIKLEIAAGNLEEGADHSKVKVPREWLLRNELPGDKRPAQPAGDAPEPAVDAAEAMRAEAATVIESHLEQILPRIDRLEARARIAA